MACLCLGGALAKVHENVPPRGRRLTKLCPPLSWFLTGFGVWVFCPFPSIRDRVFGPVAAFFRVPIPVNFLFSLRFFLGRNRFEVGASGVFVLFVVSKVCLFFGALFYCLRLFALCGGLGHGGIFFFIGRFCLLCCGCYFFVTLD